MRYVTAALMLRNDSKLLLLKHLVMGDRHIREEPDC
jgi:hypothetical protein